MDTKKLPVIVSIQFQEDQKNIFLYRLTTFGQKAAIQFCKNIDRIIYDLSFEYFMYPEYRFLKTTNKMYRNIILESYLIIYRVTKTRIELLRIFHSSVCTTNRIKPIRGMSAL